MAREARRAMPARCARFDSDAVPGLEACHFEASGYHGAGGFMT
jgi:hypothetical protein